MRALPLFLLVSTIASGAVAAPDRHPASLAGAYDGGQMEIAAMLELSRDGRFRYALSYGALDEAAAGSWEVHGDTVMLTVQQYESNEPGSDGKFGASALAIEDGVLTLPRYDRILRFRKR